MTIFIKFLQIIILMIIIFQIGVIYVIYELGYNTDNYVQVYNYLKNINKSSILLLGLNINLIKK